MESNYKEKLLSYLRYILIILLAGFLIAEFLYLLYSTLGLSAHIETNYLLVFICGLCITILAYLVYHSYQLRLHYVALNCSDKMSRQEYENMVKLMTRSEVEKLERSKAYRDYVNKKSYMRRDEDEQEELSDFSSESEKDR